MLKPFIGPRTGISDPDPLPEDWAREQLVPSGGNWERRSPLSLYHSVYPSEMSSDSTSQLKVTLSRAATVATNVGETCGADVLR